MLAVGIDWAGEFHDIALGTPEKGVVDQFRIDHKPAGIAGLVQRCLTLEPDPGEVRVVLETRHGLLVEALVDAGFTVLPVNPDLVARRRGPARKKDDPEDARICCRLALDPYLNLHALVPHGEIAGELRAIARDDYRASRVRLACSTGCALTSQPPIQRRWPSPSTSCGHLTSCACSNAGPASLSWPKPAAPSSSRSLAGRHTGPERFADRVIEAVARPALPAREYMIRAKATSIRLAAYQLLALHEARRGWEKRMGELLLGGRRIRDRAPAHPDPAKAFPGGDIYLSFPGLGDRLAARVAGEIGDHPNQYGSPNALQCYAGAAPVTRRSGKRDFVVTRRLAHNRYLGDAVHQWAWCSLHFSSWASEFYKSKVAAGKSHHAALRALGNRWLEVLWHCLAKNMKYDENLHQANRERHLQAVA